jgi:hypothetical protein
MVHLHAPTFFAYKGDKTRAIPAFHHVKNHAITTFLQLRTTI